MLGIVALSMIGLVACKKDAKKPVEQKNEVLTTTDDSASVTIEKFTNGEKEVTVSYHNSLNENYVVIKDGVNEWNLPQTEAWAKGAEYEKDGVKWKADGDKATFVVDGTATVLTKAS